MPHAKKDWIFESFIVIALITIVALYLILVPAITHEPSAVTSLIQSQNAGFQIVIFMCFFLIILSFAFFGFWYQYDIDTNPLTPEEEEDTLTREVVITGTLDDAYDVCTRSLGAIPTSRWWYTLPDRPNRALIAWPLWGKMAKINFVFTPLDTNRVRIVISAAQYYTIFSPKHPKWRIQNPEGAYAYDYTRRLAIDTLDIILREIRHRRWASSNCVNIGKG